MIIYSCTALEFKTNVDNNSITPEIEKAYLQKMGRKPNPSERSAWNNSMQFMEKIVRNSNVADDCGILIEYNIPATSMRVDFIISGMDVNDNENFIIIELKQWEQVQTSDRGELVKTFVGGSHKHVAHPSYQAWGYKQHLVNMNEAVYSRMNCFSCAYLHNYQDRELDPLKDQQFLSIIEEAPLFYASDTKKLQEFIFLNVGQGNGLHILSQIEEGKIKPSRKFIESINDLFHDNSDFILFDEQKVAFESIIATATKQDKKRTIIVHGGPGTGKSVISMNSFGRLLNKEINVKFVAPNASFRDVMVEKLVKQNPRDRTRIKNLFMGSGQFYSAPSNEFEVIIVDEAHRLKKKGAFQYRGENQVHDVIHASKVNVFFIDDNQRIRPDDIGSVDEIKKWALQYDSIIEEIVLEAQFRCAGAQGFINWIDDVLRIKDTGNFNGWDKKTFEFAILDTPNAVFDRVKDKEQAGFNSRMLAGYAWDWTSAKDGNPNGEVFDVSIDEHNFKMPWNGRSVSTTWAVHKDGVNQVGCVHTSQGLEFDYVGVIVGNDLRYDTATNEFYTVHNEYKDRVGKKGLKNEEEELNKLIKQVYKVLMSRGMKGCYIYCRDNKLQEYLKSRLDATM